MGHDSRTTVAVCFYRLQGTVWMHEARTVVLQADEPICLTASVHAVISSCLLPLQATVQLTAVDRATLGPDQLPLSFQQEQMLLLTQVMMRQRYKCMCLT